MKRWLFAILVVLAFSASASADTAYRLHQGGVTFVAPSSLSSAADDLFPEAFADLEAIYRDLPDLPRPARIEIRLVHQTSDFVAVAPAGSTPPEWADGLAYSGHGVVLVAMTRDGRPIDVRKTLRHELAHLALTAALSGNVPRWLNEGFAFLHSEDFSLERIGVLTSIAWSSNAYPLEALAYHFPPHKHGTNRAYAQAYDFVAFLTRRGRYPDRADDGDRWAFRDFLAAMARGNSADTAARSVYHADLATLWNEWLDDLRSRFLAAPVGLFGAGMWVFGALLLTLAYIRKRRRARRILAVWDLEEGTPEATYST